MASERFHQMPLLLTRKDWEDIFPKAPDSILDAFTQKLSLLHQSGITRTRIRLSFALANVEHECNGYAIPNLTENINYTAERMAVVWPRRFNSPADVVAKYGSAPGWQKVAFDDIYGNRMGNRPHTHDGSTYIGRGGPQITGRDAYIKIGELCGKNLVDSPELAASHALQPDILAAFWKWKRLDTYADQNDFIGCVRAWNGGTVGLEDRERRMESNAPIIRRLAMVDGTS